MLSNATFGRMEVVSAYAPVNTVSVNASGPVVYRTSCSEVTTGRSFIRFFTMLSSFSMGVEANPQNPRGAERKK